jgi:Zn-dependent protease
MGSLKRHPSYQSLIIKPIGKNHISQTGHNKDLIALAISKTKYDYQHIDPVGTILVPGLMLAFTGFVFGWAKPVPVNIRNLRNPKHDMAIVALAGPAANFLMALGWALFARLGVLINTPEFSIPMIYVGIAGIMINLILGLLNLLPIPPLDGSRILSWILPGRLSLYYDQFEKYGFYLLVLLLMIDSLGVVLGYPLSIAKGFFFSIAGL